MKMFYSSRSAARAVKARSVNSPAVRDMKGNESRNGFRWAVDFKANKS